MKKLKLLFALFACCLAIAIACRKDPGINTQGNNNNNNGSPFYTMPKLPVYFPTLNSPPDNPTTVDGVNLGRMLFYDPILSSDSSKSCFSCHAQSYAFTDHGTQFSTGVTKMLGTKNAMAVINLGFRLNNGFFWNGRAETMEDQAVGPVQNPIELHESWGNVVAKLQRSSFYPALFKKAFGTSTITQDYAVKAIAQFERTIVSFRSKFDNFHALGDPRSKLTASEFNGYVLFTTDPVFDSNCNLIVHGADCFHCHDASHGLFQDISIKGSFRNNGLDSASSYSDYKDSGYASVTHDSNDMGKFRVPTLRNIALTAPYMHDGRFKTLQEVIAHYDHGTHSSPTVDPLMAVVKDKGCGGHLQLSAQDTTDLCNFLRTLTDTAFINNPAYRSPFK